MRVLSTPRVVSTSGELIILARDAGPRERVIYVVGRALPLGGVDQSEQPAEQTDLNSNIRRVSGGIHPIPSLGFDFRDFWGGKLFERSKSNN